MSELIKVINEKTIAPTAGVESGNNRAKAEPEHAKRGDQLKGSKRSPTDVVVFFFFLS